MLDQQPYSTIVSLVGIVFACILISGYRFNRL